MVDNSTIENQEQHSPIFDRGINPAIPANSPDLTVTFQEWSRLKEHIRNIRSRESLWLSSASALLSAGIAFLIGVISLEQLNEVDERILIGFYCATAVGIAGAIICLIAYIGSRSRRRRDMNIAIQHMEDIEAI